MEDLPSYKELRDQLRLLRTFSFLPGVKRSDLRSLSAQLEELVKVVDDFYELLGPGNWIFHDDLRVNDMLAIEREHAGDPSGAQAALIAWYQAEDHLDFMVGRLRANPAWRARMHLLESAVADYRAGRYYAVVQVLLSVMDGFVNDMDPAKRKGLHALDGEDIDPWDSVVGVHGGLAATQATFRKTFRARSEEPVTELYRNGIVHGMLTNYDNAIVATKAWNRLLAVADWEKSLRRKEAEAAKPPAPTFREAVSQMMDNQRRINVLDSFEPRHLTPGDTDFDSHGAYVATSAFLAAWEKQRWGLIPPMVAKSAGGTAVSVTRIKDDYASEKLTGYQIDALAEQGAPACLVHVTLTINDEVFRPALRWAYENDEGAMRVPGFEEGRWKLVLWGTLWMKRDAAADDAEPDA